MSIRQSPDGILRRLPAGVLSLIACHATGTELLDRFVDPEDGRFDASDWPVCHKGFLPVPILVTEPAVGDAPASRWFSSRNAARDHAARRRAWTRHAA